jgi:hypothetical protein
MKRKEVSPTGEEEDEKVFGEGKRKKHYLLQAIIILKINR